MNVLLVGMNHRTAPLSLRERYATDEARAPLSKLVSDDDVEEAVLLSTCNRVEVLVATRRPDRARLRLRSFFERELDREGGGGRDPALDAALYEYVDSSAVRHAFRVACSLDSMVVGEPQILGQVKEAWRISVACGACGPILGRLLERAFATAKRVRAETRIAERPVSVARVAAQLAAEIFEELSDKTALLVGAGDMTELALETLRGAGLRQIRVANRTPARAAELAGRFLASAHGLDELPALLAEVDVVLTSIGGDGPILDLALVSEAVRTRRHRPLFVIDIGVPRNVDPRVDELEEVFLYDIDDLGALAEANAEERRRETVRAEAIVLEEEQRFDGWLAALGAVPTIRDLRDRAEGIRAGELERALARLNLDEPQRAGVEALTRALVNKLLHAPLARLREHADREQGFATLEAARALFGLDEAGPAPDPGFEGDPDPDADSDPVADAQGEAARAVRRGGGSGSGGGGSGVS